MCLQLSFLQLISLRKLLEFPDVCGSGLQNILDCCLLITRPGRVVMQTCVTLSSGSVTRSRGVYQIPTCLQANMPGLLLVSAVWGTMHRSGYCGQFSLWTSFLLAQSGDLCRGQATVGSSVYGLASC